MQRISPQIFLWAGARHLSKRAWQAPVRHQSLVKQGEFCWGIVAKLLDLHLFQVSCCLLMLYTPSRNWFSMRSVLFQLGSFLHRCNERSSQTSLFGSWRFLQRTLRLLNFSWVLKKGTATSAASRCKMMQVVQVGGWDKLGLLLYWHWASHWKGTMHFAACHLPWLPNDS